MPANDNEIVPPLTAAQLAELERRCAQVDAGHVTCEPWETVMARLINELS